MKSQARIFVLVACVLAACSRDGRESARSHSSAGYDSARAAADKPLNLYAATGAGALSPEAARAIPLVYVPNSLSASVTIIDPTSYRVLRTVPVGAVPQHVAPSYDLRTLWVTNNRGNSLTPIDPTTGREGERVPVVDPYNLYFTPDGRYALVIAEERGRFDVRDPHTMTLIRSVPVECKGLNHVDFTADNRYAIATCEFSGELVKLDMSTWKPVVYRALEPRGSQKKSMPQDIRAAPDGRVFYVVDMMADGIYLIEPDSLRSTGFIPTGRGAHGIITGREGRVFYVTNRGWHRITGGRRGPGSISVFDPMTQTVVATWPVPGGGSPDMGNLTADGRELWVAGRYDEEVYVFDTATGRMTHRIEVGREPHGVVVWPQPGRFSLGHTGNMR